MPNVTHTKKVIYTGTAPSGANYTWVNVDNVTWVTAPTLEGGTTDTWEFDVEANTGAARQSLWRVEHWNVALDATLTDSFTIYQEGAVQSPSYDSMYHNPAVINIDEGTSVDFVVNGSNLTDGTVGYVITGVNNNDIDIALTGDITITSNAGTLTINVLNDLTTEPILETLTVTLEMNDSNGIATGSLSDSVAINDTSQGAVPDQTHCYSFDVASGDAYFTSGVLYNSSGTVSQPWTMLNGNIHGEMYITAAPGDTINILIGVQADFGFDLANNTPISLGTNIQGASITGQNFDMAADPDTGTFVVTLTHPNSTSSTCWLNEVLIATQSEVAQQTTTTAPPAPEYTVTVTAQNNIANAEIYTDSFGGTPNNVLTFTGEDNSGFADAFYVQADTGFNISPSQVNVSLWEGGGNNYYVSPNVNPTSGRVVVGFNDTIDPNNLNFGIGIDGQVSQYTYTVNVVSTNDWSTICSETVSNNTFTYPQGEGGSNFQNYFSNNYSVIGADESIKILTSNEPGFSWGGWAIELTSSNAPVNNWTNCNSGGGSASVSITGAEWIYLGGDEDYTGTPTNIFGSGGNGLPSFLWTVTGVDASKFAITNETSQVCTVSYIWTAPCAGASEATLTCTATGYDANGQSISPVSDTWDINGCEDNSGGSS